MSDCIASIPDHVNVIFVVAEIIYELQVLAWAVFTLATWLSCKYLHRKPPFSLHNRLDFLQIAFNYSPIILTAM